MEIKRWYNTNDFELESYYKTYVKKKPIISTTCIPIKFYKYSIGSKMVKIKLIWEDTLKFLKQYR